jgi:hypothetical protein
MIPTQRIFIAGASGSGKTTGAWRWYLSRMNRRIVIDQLGEWTEFADATVHTLPEFVQVVREYHHKPKWTITYSAGDDRFYDLVRWLVPTPDVSTSPVLALGGAAMLVDEVDLVAGQHNASPEIRTFYRRSRHVGLTILSATQRPANVSREVSAQSTHIMAYRLTEPRDRDYMADVMRWDSLALDRWLYWTGRHPHGAAWKEVATGRVLWLPESGEPVVASAVAWPSELRASGPRELPRSPEPQRQQPKRQPESESLENPVKEPPPAPETKDNNGRIGGDGDDTPAH